MEINFTPGGFAGRSLYMDTNAYDSFAELFPVRMTSIEKFHYWDCDAEHPNLIYCRLRFKTKLDPELAKQAWQLTIERQPFGDVEPKKVNGRWFWVAGPRTKSDSNRPIETWNGTGFKYQETKERPANWRLNENRIRSSTGSFLGIVVWPDPPPSTEMPGAELRNEDRPSEFASSESWNSEVIFYVHHAIADGAAAALVINEWIMTHANLCSGRPPTSGIHRLDPKLFPRRGSLGLLEWRYLKHLPKQLIALFGAAKFVFRKTVDLVPNRRLSKSNVAVSDQFPAIIGQWVSESSVERLNAEAKKYGVMLNSVLLGQLYIALARWRREHGVHSDNDWLRIIVPMSIRNVSDRRLPAANRATIVQIDRREKEMKDVSGFYKGLNREISIIRGWQLDKIFLLMIGCLSFFESFLKRAAQNDRSRGMAVFTNLGEPLRKADRASARHSDSTAWTIPIEFDPAGPIRKGTPLNVTASRYGPRLRVSMHYDAQVLTAEQADQLLERYLEQLNTIG